tara:strand:+ start:96 stop:383 length:288 start_codon:yes stop_codon:yes gene_type:complete
MAIDEATVKNIARLARIKVPEEDLLELSLELTQILSWIEQLNEVDTENVAALTSITEEVMAQREDTITEGDLKEKVLANAPDAEEAFYTVPKVVE